MPNVVAAPTQVVAYRFGPFRFRMDGRILERDGDLVRVTPKVADTLLVLLQRAGEVVSKEQLMAAVWPDVVVVEGGLTRNISMLRQAIEGDSAEGRYIETVPRRGYRFVGEVEREEAYAVLPAPPPQFPLGDSLAAAPVPRLGKWTMHVASLALVLALVSVAAFLAGQPSQAALPQDHADVSIGKHLLEKLAPAETARAREYFTRAIAVDPHSTEANAGAALALVQLTALGGLDPGLALAEARPLASRAVSIDAGNPHALAATAAVLLLDGQDLPRAERLYREAHRANPTSLVVNHGYTYLKLAMGDLPGARTLVEAALRLQPASPRLGSLNAQILYLQGDFAGAVRECRRVLDREPGYALAHYYLALSLGFLGQFEQAHANLQAARMNPDVLATDRAWLLARQGDLELAKALWRDRQKQVDLGQLRPSAMLLLAATLEDTELGLLAVQSAIQDHSAGRLMMRLDPRLSPLRKSPRIAELMDVGDPRVTASTASHAGQPSL